MRAKLTGYLGFQKINLISKECELGFLPLGKMVGGECGRVIGGQSDQVVEDSRALTFHFSIFFLQFCASVGG